VALVGFGQLAFELTGDFGWHYVAISESVGRPEA
jgi:hypothetical protein